MHPHTASCVPPAASPLHLVGSCSLATHKLCPDAHPRENATYSQKRLVGPAMIQLKPGIRSSSLHQSRKSSVRTKNRGPKKKNTGLRFVRVFSDAKFGPFDQIDWERRTAEITDDGGKVIFKQENIEVPKSWSALATKIAVSKYFYGDIANGTDPHKGGRETSVRQLVHRVTRTIADWGIADGYFANAEEAEIFYDELTWLCVNQHGAFNSPVWFNVGLHHQYGIGCDGGLGNYFYNRETGRAER